ncbi:MAG: hypothetical protein IJ272_08305 [Clostridia bacterium]|nr:hypothetical protein [Clostridia bacterium]
MTFFTQLKCALCPRWSCPVRYKIGDKHYYSHLGFTSTQCPKKLEKDPFYKYTKQLNDKMTEERLKKVQNRNTDNANKNEE